KTQAVLPLRGKILNVASAGKDKLTANAQLSDLMQAIGCGTLAHYREEDLRYSRIIIMTDAGGCGAHVASLLITFFYRQMPRLIDEGHLYLAVPPLYRLTHGAKTVYARDAAAKNRLLKSEFNANAKVDVGRFKGLGEMMPAQLKETTMDPAKRTLLKVVLLADDREGTADSVERLMGTKAEARFAFISDKAEFASDDLLDVRFRQYWPLSGNFRHFGPDNAGFCPFFRPFRVFRFRASVLAPQQLFGRDCVYSRHWLLGIGCSRIVRAIRTDALDL